MYWLTLIRAYFDQQFTCCISSFCVCVSACVCVYWFGLLLLLLFVLFLYWYIMEEFELPWAIVSFHYFLFYFVLRVAVCVSVMVVCEGSSLLVYVCVFFHVQLKPTLNKRKKVRNEPHCFPFVWLWVCRVDVCVSEWVWVNFFDSKRCQRVVK